MQKAEFRVVRVADIAEFPTELGNKCPLLQELGLSAYRNTEEELLEALTESACRPGTLDICLRSSRCRRFYEAFREGRTPFGDKDPIRLLECGGALPATNRSSAASSGAGSSISWSRKS